MGQAFLTCIALVLLHVVLAQADPIIHTVSGKVEGIRYQLPGSSATVDAYLGIPFAKPPIGHLRFRHPHPVKSWDGIYNAKQLPNSCYQTLDTFFHTFKGSNMWNPTTEMSEDCLYLNVWTPSVPGAGLRDAAVLVWLHGGGFYSGTSTLDMYDGKTLAAMHNVIVVSVNYRVGALGFLTLDHPGAPGNAGLFDQLMGLAWVQQNIRFFGGDPGKVTLMGQTAGAVSASMHLLSPLSRSKFQRAILQSGVAQMPWSTLDMNEAKRRAIELAVDILDCQLSTDMKDILACLRNIPAQELVDNEWVSRGIMQFPFVPVVDGVFLTETPVKALEHKHFKKCPILLGSNLNEGSYFMIYELIENLRLSGVTMDHDRFKKSMNELFLYYPQYPRLNNAIGLEAIKFQYANYEDPDNATQNVHLLDQAVDDCHFLCHVNTFADTYAEEGENVYKYLFSERYQSNPWPEWMGVLQGDEIQFTFGMPMREGQNFTDDEMQLSRRMMEYWTNFAKTGDPNSAPGESKLDIWPVHTPNGKEYLELNSKFNNASSTSEAVGRGPRTKECAFWNDYLPYLVSSAESWCE